MKWRIGMLCLAAFGFLGLATAQDPKKTEQAKKDAPKTEQKTEAGKEAKIKVLVSPDASVELRIDGQLTRSTGDVREFVTPKLDPTKKYSYKFSALIEPNNYTKITRNREIEFKAGDDVLVDLRTKLPTDEEDVKIRWVPTPDDICEEMAKLAKIGKDDVVYDLGCGDAITIRTAVKKFGAKKGIGVDIDPERIKDAKKAAKDDGIADKIEIREGDILKLKPLDDANVVMIYMSDYMMDQLQPLFEKLKPGSRIVSHRFVMAKWKADKSITVTGKDGDEYNLHLWIVPEKKK
jgi:uncharacterized protein (TIGR03000 family)